MGTNYWCFIVLHEDLPHVALISLKFSYFSIKFLFHKLTLVCEKKNCKIMVFLSVCFVMVYGILVWLSLKNCRNQQQVDCHS